MDAWMDPGRNDRQTIRAAERVQGGMMTPEQRKIVETWLTERAELRANHHMPSGYLIDQAIDALLAERDVLQAENERLANLRVERQEWEKARQEKADALELWANAKVLRSKLQAERDALRAERDRLADDVGIWRPIAEWNKSECARLESSLTELQAKYDRAQEALRDMLTAGDWTDEQMDEITAKARAALDPPPQETSHEP
jgi:chromosome segregation ATPase